MKPGTAAVLRRLSSLCPEREISFRTGGKVKVVRISTRAQFRALVVLAAASLALLWMILSLASETAALARDRAALASQGQAVASKASKVLKYQQSVDQLARSLEARQDFMDELYRTHFGQEGLPSGEELLGASSNAPEPATRRDRKISFAPEAAPLLKMDARQRRSAMMITSAIRLRADRAAAAIRSLGLNPDAVIRTAARAQGGPFVPWTGEGEAMPAEFQKLASALSRMEFLESGLSAMPSGRPTATPMLSSSFGYRRDPFNGRAAFHAGVDFPGSYGQPILAAAPGRVSFVGQRSGYGNVVEVEHGNGLMTRYAHLSGFTVRRGQQVSRGDRIARMGSTGRSTGTHLHFEVRLKGQAVNPRPFLEARRDVRQAQQIAKTRLTDSRKQG